MSWILLTNQVLHGQESSGWPWSSNEKYILTQFVLWRTHTHKKVQSKIQTQVVWLPSDCQISYCYHWIPLFLLQNAFVTKHYITTFTAKWWSEWVNLPSSPITRSFTSHICYIKYFSVKIKEMYFGYKAYNNLMIFPFIGL